MAHPLNLGTEAALAMAQLCCDDTSIPQGAPTSPILSNMICRRLDRELTRLADDHNCIYTRYADDLTFSTHMVQFPAAIAKCTKDNESSINVVLGKNLTSIIEHNSFHINRSKIRVSLHSNRQTVTGLIVNDTVSIPKEWWRDLRAMVHAVKTYGIQNSSKVWAERFDTRSRAGESPALDAVINGKLMFARMVSGSEHPKYIRYARSWLDAGGDFVDDTIRKDLSRLDNLVSRNESSYKYDLAISFASEQEDRVYAFFNAFEEAGLRVFFAPELQRRGQFFGRDLPDELKRAFQSESRWCVVFASNEYVSKNWAGFERQIIVDSFIQRGNRDYVLPIKFDDVKIDGLPDSLGHMSPADGDDKHLAGVVVSRVRQE